MADSSPNNGGHTRIQLSSMLGSVRADEAMNDSALLAVLVEDLCWRFAMDDLRSRRRRRWIAGRRRRQQWRTEYAELCEQRTLLCNLARLYGLAVL